MAATAERAVWAGPSRRAPTISSRPVGLRRACWQAAATDDPRRRLEAAKALVAKTSGASDRDELAIELRGWRRSFAMSSS